MIKVKTFQTYARNSKITLQEEMANILNQWQRQN